MRFTGLLRSTAVAVVFTAAFAAATAVAQTKITVGKTTGGSGFHIPTYVAMDQGFYQAEGLDARFIAMTGKALVTAGLSGNVDFVPIPSGGAQAALSGADIRYVVGQSLKSQWVIIAKPEVRKVEDLKGKVLGYGRAGSADYDEGATVLARFFKLEAGKDYKVISFQGEPERIAALINGDIQGGLVSAPHAAKAKTAGLHALMRTGDYLPRVGGTVWTTKAYVEKNPETVKKFIRAVARGVAYFRDNRAGSIASLKTHLGVPTDEEAGFIWDELHNTFGAELPSDLFREIFESRRIDMVAAGTWEKDKPLPDTEAFLTRDLLEQTLKGMNYVPTKTDAKTN
ncbi:MAG: ABC transporter substrate-binding protein [Rhodospirillaceae bacterium]